MSRYDSSNAVVCSHLILAYTVWLTIINAVELEWNGCLFFLFVCFFCLFVCFFTFIEECCVVIEKNIDKKLANRISYQIWYKRCLKGKFGRAGDPNLRRGDPYPLADLDPPPPSKMWHRCDTGIPGEKSGLKYPSHSNFCFPWIK